MDDRSERLRRRRKQSTARSNGDPESKDRPGSDESEDPRETTEPSDSSGSSNPSKPSKPSRDEGSGDPSDDGDERESIPVKEQQTGTYMYLPETQVKNLRRQYNVLKAEYEFEYDEEFEKNRHFYPLVVEYGLERLDELDTEQIRARLEEFYR